MDPKPWDPPPPAGEESEQETSDEEAAAAAAAMDPKRWAPPPPAGEESEQETSDEEGEEADDEMAAKGAKRRGKKRAPPSKDHDRRLFDLGKNVWPSSSKVATKAATKAAANSGAGREPDEMCELYPYLADEVKALRKAHPGLFKREFGMINDSKARALDEKIKKQRHAQMKLHLRCHDLTKEVTKTLMDLAE